ncbi:MAG: SRPBCC family protein [Acidimicrobiales bacterium]
MDSRSTIALTAGPDRVFAEVANLDNYPAWLGLVQRAERCERLTDDPGPAWMVDLGARLGPIRRTKRVRMVRAEARPPKLVRFERRETDGRQHSAWTLTAEIEAAVAGSRLTMGLHYGGGARIPGVDRLLTDEVRRATKKLEKRFRS